MIEVTVRWFAAYRELTGVESETIATATDTPAALFDEMTTRHQKLGRRDSALVAINDEMADWGAPLTAGDDRFAAQRRVACLLAGCEKCVSVDMDNGPPVRAWQINPCHGNRSATTGTELLCRRRSA